MLGQLHLIYYRLLSCPSFKEHPRRVLGPFPNVLVWTWNPWAQVSATTVNKFSLVNSLGPSSSIANSHQHCHNSCSRVLASFCSSHASCTAKLRLHWELTLVNTLKAMRGSGGFQRVWGFNSLRLIHPNVPTQGLQVPLFSHWDRDTGSI